MSTNPANLIQREGLVRLRVQPVRRYWMFPVVAGQVGRNNLMAGETVNNQLVFLAYNRPSNKYAWEFVNTVGTPLVRCHISNLFYLGRVPNPVTDPATNLVTVTYHEHDFPDVGHYWRHRARIQFGQHVYVTRKGSVDVVWHGLDQNGVDLIVEWRSLNQLYPCVVRFEDGPTVPLSILAANQQNYCHDPKTRLWRKGTYRLTVGLQYRLIPTVGDYKKGNRYYVRETMGTRAYKWGQVFEVPHATLTKYTELAASGRPLACGPHFALYVCAGAKLVVIDDYHEDPTTPRTHNRTLVQQGGVVLVEGQLRMRPPTTNKKRRFDWSAMGQELRCADPDNVGRVAGVRVSDGRPVVEFPVLFLAPNESEYGSIAWELTINRAFTPQDPNGLNRECILSAPEGGRIEAILDWTEGAAEIEARHRYERLYESNVLMQNELYKEQDFKVPDDTLLADRILTNRVFTDARPDGIDRTVFVDIDTGAGGRFQALRRANQDPLPLHYNSHRVIDWYDYGNRPPMAPDWPLISYANAALNANTTHTEPKFNTHTNQQEVKYCCEEGTGRVLGNPYMCYDTEWGTADFSKVPVPFNHPIYRYQPMGVGTNPNVVCDGTNAYLGVNGRVYEKVAGQDVGQGVGEWASVYCKEDLGAD